MKRLSRLLIALLFVFMWSVACDNSRNSTDQQESVTSAKVGDTVDEQFARQLSADVTLPDAVTEQARLEMLVNDSIRDLASANSLTRRSAAQTLSMPPAYNV